MAVPPHDPADSTGPAAEPTGAGKDRPRRRLRPVLVLLAVAVLVGGLLTVVLVNRNSSDDGIPANPAKGSQIITATDGVKLAALVTEPTGGGRHPLVIMPSSYNADRTEYVAVARTLTAAGFVTVSYTQRGFKDSGGQVDLAGEKTRRDARTVLDWALRRTTADPKRVGMLGVSYGGGISLLTAAADKRIRAVVALSTWTDFAAAFHPYDTVNSLGLNGLLTVNRAAPQLRQLAAQLRADPLANGARFDRFARLRSPVNYLDQLNRNKPAIMIGNAWEDTLLSPAPIVPFYNRLRTPKRLQLMIGDHVNPEMDLLAGRRSDLGDAAYAWLAHYLDGKDNGIEDQQPVQLQDAVTKQLAGFPSWPNPTRATGSLAAPSTSAVAVVPKPSTWQASLTVGQDSGARIGVSQFARPETFVLPFTSVKNLSPQQAMVWAAGPVPSATRVLGSVRYSLSVSANAPAVSLFAYLYDTGPDGVGRLMAMTPVTVTGLGNGATKRVNPQLEPIAWTLAAGHQLTLVIDTVEPWWLQVAPNGTRVTVSSTAAAPATLSAPLG